VTFNQLHGRWHLDNMAMNSHRGRRRFAMIELTEEQVKAMEAQKSPLQVVNPQTQEIFVVIRKKVYDLTCSIVGGQRGSVWDDEDDDLIRK
jgi:hypothetical protein